MKHLKKGSDGTSIGWLSDADADYWLKMGGYVVAEERPDEEPNPDQDSVDATLKQTAEAAKAAAATAEGGNSSSAAEDFGDPGKATSGENKGTKRSTKTSKKSK